MQGRLKHLPRQRRPRVTVECLVPPQGQRADGPLIHPQAGARRDRVLPLQDETDQLPAPRRVAVGDSRPKKQFQLSCPANPGLCPLLAGATVSGRGNRPSRKGVICPVAVGKLAR